MPSLGRRPNLADNAIADRLSRDALPMLVRIVPKRQNGHSGQIRRSVCATRIGTAVSAQLVDRRLAAATSRSSPLYEGLGEDAGLLQEVAVEVQGSDHVAGVVSDLGYRFTEITERAQSSDSLSTRPSDS